MNDHLPPVALNALADGELTHDELHDAKQHLDHCLACSSAALEDLLLKNAVSKIGRRYKIAEDFDGRMKAMLSSTGQPGGAPDAGTFRARPAARWTAVSGWIAAAILLVAVGVGVMSGFLALKLGTATSERDALTAEVMDDHVAMMAANQQPQVLSSDRHTVKPWFQGKLPFSFNLPQTLPADVALAGANLSYLAHQPVAQLIFTIGKHKASLFLEARTSEREPNFNMTRDGFHVIGLRANHLDIIAVSDADPTRLAELARLLKNAQTEP